MDRPPGEPTHPFPSVLGQIDEICDRFESDWRQAKNPRLEDYLEQVSLETRPSLLRHLLLVEWELRTRDGDRPEIREYVTRFADLSDVVLDALGRAGDRTTTRVTADTEHYHQDQAVKSSSDDPSDSMVGDYLLLEELGRGGMGVVFRAKQRAANRDVAIKLVRNDRLAHGNDEVVRRFENEAKAAAGLVHDNIVRVYDVGEAAGRHYYSMQLVHGKSLADLVQEKPLDGRAAARYLEGVARAVHFAHTKGILHRDLKPQNVLIEAAHDRALVTDFGLAKVLGEETALTSTGAVFGSPSYMSPEQAENSRDVGAGSDVYGMGATLYHALVGRPPFQAATALETLRQARETDPVVPRRLNSAIDVDLETICLKCLEKVPAQRYITAEELADDLRRFLDHKPIFARPVGPLGRARRWCRRRPLVAALSVALAAMMVLGTAGVFAQWRRAEANRARAESNFQFSRKAVNDLFVEVSQNELLNEPGMQPLRETLLRRALEYYQVFVERQPNTPQSRRDSADALLKIALIRDEIGTNEDSLDHFHRAADALEKLVRQLPDDEGLRSSLAEAYHSIGDVHIRMGDTSSAEKELLKAIQKRTELAQDFPSSWVHTLEIAKAHLALADAQRKTNQLDASRAHVRDAASAFQMLPDEAKTEPGPRDVAAEVYARIGEQGKAIELRKQLLTDAPRSMRQRYALADTYYAQAMRDRERSPEGAIQALEETQKLMEPLAAANPDVKEYQQLLGETYDQLAFILARKGRLDRAAVLYEQALMIFEELAISDPSAVRNRDFVATIYNGLALVDRDRQRYESSLEWFQKALRIQEELVDEFPNLIQLHQDRAGTYHNIGRLHERAQQFDEAATAYETAMELLLPWAESNAKAAMNQINSMRSLVDVNTQRGDLQAVSEILTRWETLCREWLSRKPGDAEFRTQLSTALAVRARLHLRQKMYEAAIQSGEEADALFQALRHDDPEYELADLSLMAVFYNNLGYANLQLNRLDAAASAYSAAIDCYLRLKNTGRKFDESLLLAAYATQGGIALSTGKHEEAVEALDHALTLSDAPDIKIARADALVKLGRQDQAFAGVSELPEGTDGALLFEAAKVVCRAARRVEDDPALEENQRTLIREKYRERALQLLAYAKQNGFFDKSENSALLRKDGDIDVIRNHVDFAKLGISE